MVIAMNDDKTDKKGDADGELFRSAVGDVRPIKSSRQILDSPRPKPKARFSRADERAALDESQHGSDETDFEMGDELSFKRPNTKQSVFKQLRRGKFAIEAELDLHGMITRDAAPALDEFLDECITRHLRCVRIVHGKGLGSGDRGPVLKNKVAKWLKRHPAIAAYCSAQRVHGGTGAVYVLLRK